MGFRIATSLGSSLFLYVMVLLFGVFIVVDSLSLGILLVIIGISRLNSVLKLK